MPQTAPSRYFDQFNVRLPPRMRTRLSKLAKSNHRSMNAEIVFHLERAIEAQSAQSASEGAATPPKASPEA